MVVNEDKNVFKSKLEKFILKRALIVFIILTIIDIVFINGKWFAFCGLLIGGLLSILKFSSYAWVFAKIITPEPENTQKKYSAGNAVIVFILNQVLLLPLMLVTLKINLMLFAGFVAGILLVHLILLMNCITEGLRITHNHFE